MQCGKLSTSSAPTCKPSTTSDKPELSDEWFLRAAREGQPATPPARKPTSIKLDEDVLDYFKGHGTHYQAHINTVLRAYMQAQRIVQSK